MCGDNGKEMETTNQGLAFPKIRGPFIRSPHNKDDSI